MANTESGLTKLTRKAPQAAMRPDVRNEVRENNPADRARQRAAEIRKHRAGLDLDSTDRFAFDTSIIPDGWSYEWKRKSIYNQEDPAYQIRLADGGWTPVPASRHPNLMPVGNYATIERDGMVLMERPKELTDEAKDIELRRARNQVRAKEAQLSATPDGTLSRDADPRTRPSVRKSYEAMPIPKE